MYCPCLGGDSAQITTTPMMRSKFILIVTFLGLLESSGLWGEVALLDEVTLVVEVGVLD